MKLFSQTLLLSLPFLPLWGYGAPLSPGLWKNVEDTSRLNPDACLYRAKLKRQGDDYVGVLPTVQSASKLVFREPYDQSPRLTTVLGANSKGVALADYEGSCPGKEEDEDGVVKALALVFDTKFGWVMQIQCTYSFCAYPIGSHSHPAQEPIKGYSSNECYQVNTIALSGWLTGHEVELQAACQSELHPAEN